MGCSSSRPDANPAETALLSLEKSLLFWSRSVTQHYYAVRRYSQNSLYLNEAAFQSAAKTMKIQVTNVPENFGIEAFYKALRDEQGLIHARDLVGLAVLLGKGNTKDKATVLFESYDERFLKSIGKAEIAEMLRSLIELSTVRLAALVDGTHPQKGEIETYLSKLASNKESSVSFLTEAILNRKSQISAEEFLQRLKQDDICAILSTYGLRRSLGNILTNQPA